MRVHRPATVRAEDAERGGYIVSPAIVEDPPPDTGIVREEQFGPALPVIGYGDICGRGGRRQRHRVRALRVDMERRRGARRKA